MIDITIIATFLVVTLFVGLSHGQKVSTIKEYAIGNRDFSTGAIVATLVATWISGSTFFIALSKTYSNGLYYVIASSGMALSFLLTAFLFVPRMNKLLGKTSIAEVMGDWYGRNVRIITAISGTIGDIGIIAVQFKVFGGLFNYFFGIANTDAIIIASLIVIFYSTFGGIRAVTSTDILQFFTFGLSVPIIGIIIWNYMYQEGIDFSNAMSSSKFNLSEVFDIRNPEFLQIIPLLFYFALPGMEPKFCQRILMGRDIKQIKKAFIISATLLIVTLIFIQWIPFLLFNINPNIESNNLFNYIIDNFTYPGLKGILIVGIIAMAMSSADSAINASSVLFSHDICRPH